MEPAAMIGLLESGHISVAVESRVGTYYQSIESPQLLRHVADIALFPQCVSRRTILGRIWGPKKRTALKDQGSAALHQMRRNFIRLS
jgi:hypothetical protein